MCQVTGKKSTANCTKISTVALQNTFSFFNVTKQPNIYIYIIFKPVSVYML